MKIEREVEEGLRKRNKGRDRKEMEKERGEKEGSERESEEN